MQSVAGERQRKILCIKPFVGKRCPPSSQPDKCCSIRTAKALFGLGILQLARALQYEGAMNLSELKHKQEIYALAQYVIGFVVVGLVLVGIGGTIYKVISPDGWIALAFGRSLSAGAASLGSLIMIAGLAWFSRGWNSPRYRNRFSDLLVFSFAAAGLLYLGQLMLQGSF